MTVFGAGGMLRPTSCSIYTRTPSGLRAFLLGNTPLPSKDRFRFDITDREQVTRPYSPAVHPIEGSLREQLGQATDHVQREPIQFTVAGIMSANPIGHAPIAGALIGSFGSLVRRDLIEYRKLVEIADRRARVMVVVEEEAFSSMFITLVQRLKGPDTGNAVEIAVSFFEARVVSPLLVAGVPDLDELDFGAQEGVTGGSGQGESVGISPEVIPR